MAPADATLLLHAGATLIMVGLIWFVQVVHYPLMGGVGRERAPGYALAHQRLTTRVVLPPMLTEAATAVIVAARPPAGVPPVLAAAGLAAVAALWASTFLVQVPLHRRLASGFDPADHRRLVATNWARTALWTVRGALALWMLQAAR